MTHATMKSAFLKTSLVALSGLALASCDMIKPSPNYNLAGDWYLVELNGKPTPGSRVDLNLRNVHYDELRISEYRLDINCDDFGRLNESGTMISDYHVAGNVPDKQCEAEDPGRMDTLRRMTHEGVKVQLDPKLFTATLTTNTGQTARFDFMPSELVD